MNVRQQRKLFAGVGMISALFGALMVLVPAGAGAEDLPIATKVTVCHRTNAVTNPYRVIEVAVDGSDGSLGNGNNDHTNHPGAPFDFANPEKYEPPFNGDDWGDIIPPYRWGPGEDQVFPGLNWDPQQSQEQQCRGEEPPEPTTLTLVKQVAGAAAPTSWSYDFGGLVDDVTLTNLVSTSEAMEIDPGVTYEIAESGTDGVVSASCTKAAASSLTGRTLSVSVDEGEDAVCTFVNTFEPQPNFSIAVDKVNDADGSEGFGDSEQAPTAGASVPFQLTITNDGDEMVTVDSVLDTWSGQAEPLDVLALADLDCDVIGGASDVELDGLELAAGESVVCTFTLSGYAPGAGGSRTNTITVDTDEGASDTDTSTVTTPGGQIVGCLVNCDPPPPPPVVNIDVCPDVPGNQRLVESCTEVLPAEEERPPVVTPPAPPTPPTPLAPAPAPTPEPKPEVEGDVVDRTLPRTGTESTELAVFGAGMLLLGAGLVLTSRLRFRTVD